MSLLTAVIVKNSQILAGIYLNFLLKKTGPTPKLKGFQYQIWTLAKKDRKSSYQVRQIFALFCKLVALTFG